MNTRRFIPLSLADAKVSAYLETAGGQAGAPLFAGCDVERLVWTGEVSAVLLAASGDTELRAYELTQEHRLELTGTAALEAGSGAAVWLTPGVRMVWDVRWQAEHPPGRGKVDFWLRFWGVTWQGQGLATQGFHAAEQSQRLRAERVERMLGAQ